MKTNSARAIKQTHERGIPDLEIITGMKDVPEELKNATIGEKAVQVMYVRKPEEKKRFQLRRDGVLVVYNLDPQNSRQYHDIRGVIEEAQMRYRGRANTKSMDDALIIALGMEDYANPNHGW